MRFLSELWSPFFGEIENVENIVGRYNERRIFHSWRYFDLRALHWRTAVFRLTD